MVLFAIIPAGILGPYINKINSVIGFMWQKINFFRQYHIPVQPDSASQLLRRAIYAKLCDWWQNGLFLLGIFEWYPIRNVMSTFNAYMKYNLQIMTDSFDYSLLRIASGSIEIALPLSCTYNPLNGEFYIAWQNQIFSNGLATDLVLIFLINENLTAIFAPEDAFRSVGEFTKVIPTGLSMTDYHVYLFAIRVINSKIYTSNSTYIKPTEV